MNDAERAKLVERIVATWPAGPRGFVWFAVLGDLEHEQAVSAYEHLRRTALTPPTTGAYLDAYRQLTRPAHGWPRPADTGEPVSLAEYLERNPHDDAAVELARVRHPSSATS